MSLELFLHEIIDALSEEVRSSLPAILHAHCVHLLDSTSTTDNGHLLEEEAQRKSLQSPWGKKSNNRQDMPLSPLGTKNSSDFFSNTPVGVDTVPDVNSPWRFSTPRNKSPGSISFPFASTIRLSPGSDGNKYIDRVNTNTNNIKNNQHSYSNHHKNNNSNSNSDVFGGNSSNNNIHNNNSDTRNISHYGDGNGFIQKDVPIPTKVTYSQYSTRTLPVTYYLRIILDPEIDNSVKTDFNDMESKWKQVQSPQNISNDPRSTKERTFPGRTDTLESILNQVLESLSNILDLCAECRLASERLASIKQFR